MAVEARRLWGSLLMLLVLVLAATGGDLSGMLASDTLGFVGVLGVAVAGPLLVARALFAAVDLVRAPRPRE